MRSGAARVASSLWLLAALASPSCATITEDAAVPDQSTDVGGAPVDPVRYCAESLSHPPVRGVETPGLHWPPRVLRRVGTAYPRVASLESREGRVKMRLWITATGGVDKIDVVESSG